MFIDILIYRESWKEQSAWGHAAMIVKKTAEATGNYEISPVTGQNIYHFMFYRFHKAAVYWWIVAEKSKGAGDFLHQPNIMQNIRSRWFWHWGNKAHYT